MYIITVSWKMSFYFREMEHYHKKQIRLWTREVNLCRLQGKCVCMCVCFFMCVYVQKHILCSTGKKYTYIIFWPVLSDIPCWSDSVAEADRTISKSHLGQGSSLVLRLFHILFCLSTFEGHSTDLVYKFTQKNSLIIIM